MTSKVTKPNGSKVSKFSPLYLNGDALPIVSSFLHLGHTIDDCLSIEDDMKKRVNVFQKKLFETRDLFMNIHPREQVEAVKIYCITL